MKNRAVRLDPKRRDGAVRHHGKVAATSIGALAVLAASVSVTAPAASAMQPNVKAKVVHKAKRGAFGKVLVTAGSGASLYYIPSNICTAISGCLAIWPPLLMPPGKTIPKGASGLGTEPSPSGGGGLQVTFHGFGLYTYIGDTGTSLNGNGVGGFLPAVVNGAY
jgi:hypothetical protein